jgi:hypothetical protein
LFYSYLISAKIYGFRVDALHTETQKLSGNILNTDETSNTDNEHNQADNPMDNQDEHFDSEHIESKKVARRVKAKLASFVVNDLSKITLEHEFEFRPLQPPHMCQWRGGIGKDSIYAEMVSSTMYSSSDYPVIDGFTNANSRLDEQQDEIDSILDQTNGKTIDLVLLRNVIHGNDGHEHTLGRTSQTVCCCCFKSTY